MIVVQMLFGQNPEPFLKPAIDSVSWADKFIACNTDPTSLEGALNEATFIRSCELNGKPSEVTEVEPDKNGHFSFAEARNKILDHVEIGDYVLIVDADDVHYPEFEEVVKNAIQKGADSLTAHFYHLMVYKNLYQYVQPREILYKKYDSTKWVEGVHEKLITPRKWPVSVGYHYMHYGYIKPQQEVFNRWKFYSDLVGDTSHYDGQDPNHILDDRISVSKTLSVDHPACASMVLRAYPEYPKPKVSRERVPVEKVGLLMIVRDGDLEFLPSSLETLYRTVRYPDFEVVYVVEQNAAKELEVVQNTATENDSVVVTLHDASLVDCLNFAFDEFRIRHDIQYIGWVHPDMRFDDPNWLNQLWQTLQDYPKVGKVCAANTRDIIPKEMHPGHEQCYIIRKDIVNKIGLFDEKFIGIGGWEDIDYNRRILNHDDYRVMLTPAAKVFHKGMGTREKRDTTYEQIRNAEYYNKKWGDNKFPV